MVQTTTGGWPEVGTHIGLIPKSHIQNYNMIDHKKE